MIGMHKCRAFSSKDSDTVRELIRTTFYDFLDGNYWDWKHLRNPDFDPSLVVVAEKNGEIAGCGHGIPREFKLTGDVAVDSVLGCDLAVKREQRGQGIGKEILVECRTQETVKNRKIVLFYHFTNVNLAKKIHVPFLGDTEVTSSVKQFYKITSWKNLIGFIEEKTKRSLHEMMSSKIRDLNFVILFRMIGAPPLTLRFSEGRTRVSEEKCEDADIIIEGKISAFTSFLGAKKVKWQLLKAVLKRKLKIKGKPRKLLKVYRNLDFFKDFLETVTKYIR